MRLRRVQLLFTLVGASDAALLPFLPIVLHDRGLSAAQIGVALSAASVAGFVATPLWGNLADRRLGHARTLMVAALASAAAVVPLAFAHGLAALTGSVVLVTAARSGLASLADSLALERLGLGARSDYGRVRLWQSFGWAVAACVWGIVLQTGQLGWVPGLYAASVLALALSAHLARGGRPVHEPSVRGARRAMLRSLAPFLCSLLLLFAAFSASFSFVSLRIADLGGGLFVVGLATALQAIAEVPVMRATPWLGRSFDSRTLYVAGAGFFTVAFTAWAFLDDPLTIALVKLVAGVGFALVYVGSVVIVDDLAPPGLRGTGQGLAKAVSFGLSPVVGTLAGGAVYDYAGPRVLFAVCAAAALAAGAALPMIAAWTRATPRS